jgi:hypothetical protein
MHRLSLPTTEKITGECREWFTGWPELSGRIGGCSHRRGRPLPALRYPQLSRVSQLPSGGVLSHLLADLVRFTFHVQ